MSLAQEDVVITCDNRKPTLLNKYNIPVNYLDFDYVKKCRDGREMEKIYHILLSGEEGYFPDLLKAAHDRLQELKPKSKFLRTSTAALTRQTLDSDQWNSITNDIEDWVSNVSINDKELSSLKTSAVNSETDVRKSVKVNSDTPKKPNDNRIKATDYAAWDKFDPDAEILKQDLEDRNVKEEAKKRNVINKPKKKTVKIQEPVAKAEAIFQANSEKDAGNEFFKAGDYENALERYSRSIALHPTAAAFNNRAITYIKLKKYSNALRDCHETLEREPRNVKCLIRRAQAYEAIDYFHDALRSVEQAITIEPNNCLAQNMANSLRQKCSVRLEKSRMLIHDIEESIKSAEKGKQNGEEGKCKKPTNNSSKNESIVVPIPGTSKSLPPYFKVVKRSAVNDELKRINNRPRILHIPTIYQENTDEEEENIEENDADMKSGCKVTEVVEEQTNEEANACRDNNGNVLSVFLPDDCKQTKSVGNNEENLIAKKERYAKVKQKDLGAGGDSKSNTTRANSEIPRVVETPFTFLRTWNAVSRDPTYSKHAEVLQSLEIGRLSDMIGCKLDGEMLSGIIRCASRHFTVPDKVDKVVELLNVLVRLPRFNIARMFLTPDDSMALRKLIEFLEQHGRTLSEEVKTELKGF